MQCAHHFLGNLDYGGVESKPLVIISSGVARPFFVPLVNATPQFHKVI